MISLVVASLVLVVEASAVGPVQYRAQATAVCKETSGKLKAVGTAATPDQLAALLTKSLPVFRTHYAKLKRLQPPASLRVLHRKVLSLEKTQLDGMQKLFDRIKNGTDPAQAYAQAEASLSKASIAEAATWKRLKVPACAKL
jgi:hypothetical protein